LVLLQALKDLLWLIGEHDLIALNRLLGSKGVGQYRALVLNEMPDRHPTTMTVPLTA
jgi:hypothetical protein